MCVICLAILAAGLIFAFKSRKTTPVSGTQPPADATSEAALHPDFKAAAAKELPAAPVFATAATTPSQPVPKPPSPPSANQLVAELAALGETNGTVTAEQAEKFKQNLAELVKGGAGSVPAIQEFLAKNTNVRYSDLDGGDQLGFSSLRASLIDALKQIGGPQAQAAMLQTLQTTAEPSELLALANDLNQAAPGQYTDQIVNGAKEALQMATANQLGTNAEVGPAFHIMQTYAGANTTADAANNDPQQFYNAVAYANMPNGQGLDSLVQMAANPGISQTVATEMIAQMAGQNSQALTALTEMAQNGQISQDVWVKLAPILAGSQYQLSGASSSQLSAGGQNYTIVDGATTPDQINQRIDMIDKMLNLVPGDSAASAALQHQLSILNGKLNPGPQSN